MPRFCWTAILVGMITLPGCRHLASPSEARVDGDPPSLVVLVAIDQLRPDMLERYEASFRGGLRRLLDEGFRFSNATHDHAKTVTASGHVTLATGVHPNRHGVVGNDWFELRDGNWEEVYSAEDPLAEILGYPEMPGRSPANIRRPGLPNWIAGANPAARVVSISQKDRAAIGLSATSDGHVYWLSATSGRFITSSFYASEYPTWVQRFNDEEMPRIYSDSIWVNTTPVEYHRLARPDTSAHEFDGVHTFFPHRASDLVDLSDREALNDWRLEITPLPDVAVLGLARAAIRELELGRRGAVDYLGLAFSQTDLIGHKFGPFSREQLDNLLRLDRVLGDLLATLDEEVGPGGWVLALSSDHGVLEVPEHLAERDPAARQLSRDERIAIRETVREAVASGLQGDSLASSLKQSLSDHPSVAAAYTFGELEDMDADVDSFALMFSRSHSRERVLSLPARYGVHVRYAPNILEGTSNATTHGSPYYYDRAVPLIFLGSGIPTGSSEERASTTDVAPTLAHLAGVAVPDDLDGRNLFGIP